MRSVSPARRISAADPRRTSSRQRDADSLSAGGAAGSGGTAGPRSSAVPAGYAGSDTCALCHDDRATDVARTRHGQIHDPRTPAATLGCESCHGPGQAHVDDDAKGNIRRFGALKPAEVNATCLSCHNRGVHAGWEGSTHEARNLSCTTCHSVHKPASPQHQLAKATETATCATCHRLQVTKTERAVAHMPVREGKMSCSSCHNPHGSIANVKALKAGNSVVESVHQLSRRDARADAVGTRARARELHDLPRPARVVERSHAERAHADAVSALSRRDPPSGVGVRQQRHHREQEQPDVRAIVRQLPLERSRVQPPVGPVLHAVAAARRRQARREVCDCFCTTEESADRGRGDRGAVGAGARAGASRRATTAAPPVPRRPPHRRPLLRPRRRRRRHPRPAGPLRTRPPACLPRAKQLQLSGRLSSTSGDPARWQRYQDLRDGLLFTGARLLRETPEWNGTVERRQRRLARSALLRDLRTGRPAPDPRTVGRDPAVLQRRHPHALHAHGDRRRPRARRRRAAVDPERGRQRSTRTSPSVSPQFDLRERRAIGTVSLKATPTTQLDVTGGFTTTKHSGELPWGASFGFSNDAEVRAAL